MAQRAIEPLHTATTCRDFVTRSGFVIKDFFGSDEDDRNPDNDGADGNEGEDEDDDEDDEDGSGSGGRKKKESDDDDDDGDDRLTRLEKRMKAADKRAAEAEKKVKEYEDKDKDEVTKATERADAAEARVKDLEASIGGLNLQVEFLKANDYAWDDPEYALDYAQRKGYLEDVIDDDGNIDAKELKKALKALATDKPRMLKADSTDDGDDDQDRQPSGGNVGNSRRRGKQRDEADLKRRFPGAYV